MKRKLARKLTLSRETLRNLSDEQARLVHGGDLCPVHPSCKPCDTFFDCTWDSVCIC